MAESTDHPLSEESRPSRELVAIAILAGGESRRMGRDKAALVVGGETLLDRMIDQAKRVCETVAVVGRLGEREDVLWLPDDEASLGPVGGLKTALVHLAQPVVLVACDMPRVDADSLRWLVDCFFDQADAHGLATTRGGRLEPLFSVYAPTVLELVDRRIVQKALSMRGLIDQGVFARVRAPDAVAAKLVNINTPADLDAFDP